MWLSFQMASIQTCIRSIFHSQHCLYFKSFALALVGVSMFPGASFSRSNLQFCASFVYFLLLLFCVKQIPTLFSIPFHFLKKKNRYVIKVIPFLSFRVDCYKYRFTLFWYWLNLMIKFLSLHYLLLLQVKKVPHVLLMQPFKTKYCITPVSVFKPKITKDILVQFTSYRFKLPPNCWFLIVLFSYHDYICDQYTVDF